MHPALEVLALVKEIWLLRN